MRQGGNRRSFKEASEDLEELSELKVSPAHIQRLTERVGAEWAATRDAEVEAFRRDALPATHATAPAVAAVMLDGGRVQTRAAEAGRGVHAAAWRETKVACCLSLHSREKAVDPQPTPPQAFLTPTTVQRLTAQIKGKGGPRPQPRADADKPSSPKRRLKRKRRSGPQKLVRTVVASMANSEEFGWHVAAEVQRRRLGEASRKACVCDGQAWNWTLFATHLVPWGFIGILDFVHLLTYLYAAAQAACGGDAAAVWPLYEQWLRWAWAGKAEELLRGLAAAAQAVGEPPAKAKEDDPRKVLADTVGYVSNAKGKMNYAEYRRRGLPITSAAVESVIKQLNQRIKGTEQFWLAGGVEAVLQVRAAYLSEDERAARAWKRPRPRGRAVGAGRLGRRRR